MPSHSLKQAQQATIDGNNLQQMWQRFSDSDPKRNRMLDDSHSDFLGT